MFETPSIRILAGSTAVFGLFWASWALWRRGRGAEALEQAAIEDALRDMREMRKAREMREQQRAELERSLRRESDDIDVEEPASTHRSPDSVGAPAFPLTRLRPASR